MSAAQITVLEGGVPPYVTTYAGHPLMHDMIRSISKPKFSDKPLDYAKFEADCDEVERTFRESCPEVGQEYILLQQFKECLDEATQTRLRARQKSPRG